MRYILASPSIEPEILIEDFKKVEQAPYQEAKDITDHIIKMESGKVTGCGEEFDPTDELEDKKESVEDAADRFIKNIKG